MDTFLQKFPELRRQLGILSIKEYRGTQKNHHEQGDSHRVFTSQDRVIEGNETKMMDDCNMSRSMIPCLYWKLLRWNLEDLVI